ncbi:hypothetical protein CCACVL1_03164 [Corchorus capsularis]|uniref:Uncharacterized protein n=1 Tax=Corchorus capsularis TaxID=210143 RepID=A0A1R3K1X8_COCAP|nr:hypothetical protein CCACVL1_03164 [Corchorus capsularis]
MADVEADHLSYQEVSHRVHSTMTRRCLTSAACQKPIGGPLTRQRFEVMS